MALSTVQVETFWASKKAKGASIEFNLGKEQTVSKLLLQEYIPMGQRVSSFSVYYLKGKTWEAVPQKEETTTIGYKRILRFNEIRTKALRIVINNARGPVCLSNVEAF